MFICTFVLGLWHAHGVRQSQATCKNTNPTLEEVRTPYKEKYRVSLHVVPGIQLTSRVSKPEAPSKSVCLSIRLSGKVGNNLPFGTAVPVSVCCDECFLPRWTPSAFLNQDFVGLRESGSSKTSPLKSRLDCPLFVSHD